jgi:short subunit dehydrogenase-like uncharacterized protein
MRGPILVYGASGYSGALAAQHAKERGIEILLAGRNEEKIRAVAEPLGVPFRAFGLDDPSEIDRGLEGTSVVLHCAGPFSRTARPMAEGCLRGRVHYLDITGEIDVFEDLHRLHERAKAAGIMLAPGTGFDVVPSDCLAAYLKQRVPDATHLALAFRAGGAPSHGTATTMVENLHRPGRVRRGAVIIDEPLGARTRMIDYGRGPQLSVAIPWGDVSTAYRSTGIPNIEVYVPTSRRALVGIKGMARLGGLLGSRPVQSVLKRVLDARTKGPSDEERARSAAVLWGEVQNERGDRASARLRTPDGYTLTQRTSVEMARRAATGDAHPGFSTPSMAYGADFILEFDAVERTDTSPG